MHMSRRARRSYTPNRTRIGYPEKGDGVDFGNLTKKAKQLVDKRGGTEALKEDAEEVKDIVSGEGSAMDKAKAAGEALKDPGKAGPDR
jgi:hypothetical protein